MTLDITTTGRGFAIAHFQDANNVKCSIQESSALREEGLIWLGCDDLGLQKFTPNGNPSWRPIDLAEAFPEAITFVANTRMHLTQQQVQRLLPALQYFAEHGQLPPPTEALAKVDEGNT